MTQNPNEETENKEQEEEQKPKPKRNPASRINPTKEEWNLRRSGKADGREKRRNVD